MTFEWTEWKEVERITQTFQWNPQEPFLEGVDATRQLDPYVHWSLRGPGDDDITVQSGTEDSGKFILVPPRIATVPDWFADFEGLKDTLPVPEFAAPEGDFSDSITDPDDLPELPEDTIIAGVIDVGMALGHWNTRFSDGTTRIVSAWQMLGSYDKHGDVPFGRGLNHDEINDALKDHSGGVQDGVLDQHAFNVAVGGLPLDKAAGPRDLAKRSSHGTHVLDMVAGAGRTGPEADFGDRVRIIAINAPSAAVFGPSGTYLDQFLFHGIKRIVEVADALWEKRTPQAQQEKAKLKGFAIVINIAFGKQSGSKDSVDAYVLALKTFVEQRKLAEWHPVHFVMPTGNDNQTQSNAFLEPRGNETLALDWRILPQDQSSNFVEIWADDRKNTAKRAPITPQLFAPGSDLALRYPADLDVDAWIYADLQRNEETIARVYRKRNIIPQSNLSQDPADDPSQNQTSLNGRTKLRYILCVAPSYRPTLRNRSDPKVQPSAPAGPWVVKVKNRMRRPRFCSVSVQTDQGLTPGRLINLRSYFEDDTYQRFDDMGRILDTYSYPADDFGDVTNQDILTETPIRRHGTQTSQSAHKSVARVGGFRASDGRPAFYSSTGRGRRNGSDDGTRIPTPDNEDIKRAPTASLPTEDSPALFGILGAGSSDGSVVALRGTSFACSQASRVLLDLLVSSPPEKYQNKSARQILYNTGKKAEQARKRGATGLPNPALNQLIEVIGAGRIFAPKAGTKPGVDRRNLQQPLTRTPKSP